MRTLPAIIYFLVFAFSALQGYCQDTIADVEAKLPNTDGLERLALLYDLTEKYWTNDSQKSLQYGTDALELAESLGYPREKAIANKNLGISYYFTTDYDLAVKHSLDSIPLYKEAGELRGEAIANNTLGLINDRQGRILTSLEYYLRSMKLRQELGDDRGRMIVLANIGRLYRRIGDLDKALTYHMQAMEISEIIEEPERILNTKIDLASLYIDKQEYDKGLEFLNEATSEMIQEDINGFGDAHMLYTKIYKEKGEFEQAKHHAELGIQIKKDLKEYFGLATILNDAGDIFRIQRDFNAASEYLFAARQVVNERNLNLELNENNRLIALLYKDQNNFEKAYEYQVKFSEFQKQLFDVQNAARIADHYSFYELEQKSKENAALRMDNTIQQQELIRNQYFRWFLIVIIILSFILVIILFTSYRVKMRDNDEIAKQKVYLESAMKKAEAATKAKSQFLAKMSHEMRTPLNGLIGNLELLQIKDQNQQQMELVESIHESAKTLSRIIGGVLDFAKIESNKMELESEEFLLKDLLKEIVSLMSPRAQLKYIKLIPDFDTELPYKVKGDPLRMKQVIVNLIDNAIKFTQKGGIQYLVSIAEGDPSQPGIKRLTVEIRDSGEGFHTEENELFEEFVQVNERAPQIEGTGLGLAISKKLIELMGGEIGYEGIKNTGARFWFHVPLQVIELGEPVAVPSRTMKIAIVNDDCKPAFQWLLTTLEEQHVQPTEISPLSIRQTEWDRFDIVFIASNSPVHELHEWNAIPSYLQIKRVLITESDSGILPYQALRCGIDYVLQPAYSAQAIRRILFSNGSGTTQRIQNPTRMKNVDDIKRSLEELLPLPPVLVVDDILSNRMLTKNQLAQLGLNCELAENGAEALEKVQQNEYSIILLDCSMPVMDGFEFTRQFRVWEEDRDQHKVIVAVTAHVVSGDHEKCLDCGMDDYLSKPVTIERLGNMLVKWLQNMPVVDAVEDEDDELDDEDSLIDPSDLNLTMGEDEPVQLQYIFDEMGLRDPSIIQELMQAFVEEVDEFILQIESAIQSQDRKELKIKAHAAKSASNSTAAFSLANLLQTLEYQSQEVDWENLEDIMTDIQHEYHLTRNWIQTYIQKGLG